MCSYLNVSANNLEAHGCRGSQSGQAIATMQSGISSSYCITSHKTAHVKYLVFWQLTPARFAS